MVKLNKTIVAIYIRVSTIRQAEEGYSLEAQTSKLISFCNQNDYEVYKIYSDAGKSGKDTNRPGFQNMMNDMKKGLFNKVLVVKLDRISRSVIDLELMIKEMQNNNVSFESASEKIDTGSAMGMLFIRLLGIFAQFERERITERINDAFTEMVVEGNPITGQQPMGYKIETIDGSKKVVKNEDEIAMVEDMFNYFLQCQSVRKLVIYLKNKYNKKIDYTNMKKILVNTKYYGYYENNGIVNENYCEPYLTKDEWDKVQEAISKNVRSGSKLHDYIFSGLVECATCGYSLTGHTLVQTKKEKRYEYPTYICNHYKLNKTCTNGKVYRETMIESYLLDNFLPKLDEYLIEINASSDEQEETTNLDSLKDEFDRLNHMYLKGRISQKFYDEEYERLTNEIEKASVNPPAKEISHLLELREVNLKEYYNTMDKVSKRSFWRKYIDRIIVTEDKQYNFVFK